MFGLFGKGTLTEREMKEIVEKIRKEILRNSALGVVYSSNLFALSSAVGRFVKEVSREVAKDVNEFFFSMSLAMPLANFKQYESEVNKAGIALSDASYILSDLSAVVSATLSGAIWREKVTDFQNHLYDHVIIVDDLAFGARTAVNDDDLAAVRVTALTVATAVLAATRAAGRAKFAANEAAEAADEAAEAADEAAEAAKRAADEVAKAVKRAADDAAFNAAVAAVTATRATGRAEFNIDDAERIRIIFEALRAGR
jgi:hypothetical protein